ncbi:MAG: alpha,alpha-trehalose-phosphate synthase (UDP-forming) [Acidimicrobiales bacterium]
MSAPAEHLEPQPAGPGQARLLIATNRGPTSLEAGPGGTVNATGGGGLVASVAPLVGPGGATWVSVAERDLDAAGFRLRAVRLEPETYSMAYNVVCNQVLWYMHHDLFDLARRPVIGRHFRRAWEAYRELNRRFAEVIAAEAAPGATVLAQDYHLCLLASELSVTRPDLRCAHFSHTPFTTERGLEVLPSFAANELIEAMNAFVACGFHCERWAREFKRCSERVLGTEPATFVSPLGPDPASLQVVASSDRAVAAAKELSERFGDVQLIVRADRIEPSKNLLRGFLAFEEMLDAHPELLGRVTLLALVYPSREQLADYQAYRLETEALVDRINRSLGLRAAVSAPPGAGGPHGGWSPIVLDVSNDYPKVVAALQSYDVLLVNPIIDGLNLVAKEGPVLNRNDGVVVLSERAGAFDELSVAAVGINPFDVSATADAMWQALTMSPAERASRAQACREASVRRSPATWLEDQLRAAREAPG